MEAKAAFHQGLGGPWACDLAKDSEMTGLPKSTAILGTSELPKFLRKSDSILAVWLSG